MGGARAELGVGCGWNCGRWVGGHKEGVYWFVIHCAPATYPAHCSPEESLLVLRGLGIQTSSSSPTYLSTPTTRFIPTTAIQDIFIHEAFKGFEVRFYLAIVVQGEEDVVVVFPVSHEPQTALTRISSAIYMEMKLVC